jgi:hypothetical protein
MRSLYQEILNRLKFADELEVRYSFDIAGVNSRNRLLERLLSDVSTAKVKGLEDAVSQGDSLQSILPLFALHGSEGRLDADGVIAAARSDDTFVRFVESTHESNGYQGIAVTGTGMNRAQVNCLCFHDFPGATNTTPADRATAAVLQKYARRL